MANNSITLMLACVVITFLVISSPLAQAITCGQVAAQISPCLSYLASSGGQVPVRCCTGVRNLNSEAKTTPDRQQACRCLKSLAGSVPGMNYNLASGLPAKCGINIPYKISPETDCNSVK